MYTSILFHSDRWKEFVPAELHDELESKIKSMYSYLFNGLELNENRYSSSS